MEKTGQSHFAGQPLGPKMDFIQILTRGGTLVNTECVQSSTGPKLAFLGPFGPNFRVKKRIMPLSAKRVEKSQNWPCPSALFKKTL